MRTVPALALVVAVTGVATPLSAQTANVCPDTATLRGCIGRTIPNTVDTDLKQKPVGTQTGGGTASSATADYLPKLAAALLTPGVAQDLGALALSANLPLNDGVNPWPLTLQGGVNFNNPAVNQQALDSIPQTTRSSIQDSLKEKLNTLSDVTFTVALNLETPGFGRSFVQHRRELSELLLRIVDISGDWTQGAQATIDYARYVEHHLVSLTGCPEAKPGVPLHLETLYIKCISPDARDSVVTLARTMIDKLAAQQGAIQDNLRLYQIKRMADLIDNQPQMMLTFTGRARDALVGPGQLNLQFRLESGPANLNGARRYCRRNSSTPGATLQPECFREYVLTPSVQRQLDYGLRLWAAAEANRDEAFDFDIPGTTKHLHLDQALSAAVSGGFGSYLGASSSNPPPSRIDATIRGEWHKAGTGRPVSRWVASIIETQKLDTKVSALVGLTWANRPEFLGHVDKKLRANLGLTYRMVPDKPQQ